jgi:hypothetical protein
MDPRAIAGAATGGRLHGQAGEAPRRLSWRYETDLGSTILMTAQANLGLTGGNDATMAQARNRVDADETERGDTTSDQICDDLMHQLNTGRHVEMGTDLAGRQPARNVSKMYPNLPDGHHETVARRPTYHITH